MPSVLLSVPHLPQEKFYPQMVSLEGFLTAWIEMDQISAMITR